MTPAGMRVIPQNATFSFTGLSLDEAQYLIAILSERPLKTVLALYNKMERQLDEQTMPPEPASTGPDLNPPTLVPPAEVSGKTEVATAVQAAAAGTVLD